MQVKETVVKDYIKSLLERYATFLSNFIVLKISHFYTDAPFFGPSWITLQY